jgi:predicted acyltransferase
MIQATEHRGTDAAPPDTGRLASLDAYRGFVILLMLTQLLALNRVADSFPDSTVWRIIAFHADHVPWEGGGLLDLVQPSFSFLVGVALPFSLASRRARGQSLWQMTLHALWRSAVLVGLGVFLHSVGKTRTYWAFDDTLCQIGLGYPFLFLLGYCSPRVQWAAVVAILVGYWAAFVLYAQGHPEVASPWVRSANAGWALDTWFLNLFPRESTYTGNRAGVVTVAFVGRLATMTLGLIAGGWLRNAWPAQKKSQWMIVVGLAGLATGEALDRFGLCPVIWRLWTPSWTLWSGGWCFLFLAAFCLLLDVWRVQRWAFPLTVLGMNAITMYCLKFLIDEFIRGSIQTHLGPNVFKVFGEVYEPLVSGGSSVLVLWLIALWMYRRKVFVRV